MKTVVITGSARGFGLEMLKLFRKENFNFLRRQNELYKLKFKRTNTSGS